MPRSVRDQTRKERRKKRHTYGGRSASTRGRAEVEGRHGRQLCSMGKRLQSRRLSKYFGEDCSSWQFQIHPVTLSPLAVPSGAIATSPGRGDPPVACHLLGTASTPTSPFLATAAPRLSRTLRPWPTSQPLAALPPSLDIGGGCLVEALSSSLHMFIATSVALWSERWQVEQMPLLLAALTTPRKGCGFSYFGQSIACMELLLTSGHV